MAPNFAERFCKEEIESLIHQIRDPRTQDPQAEIPELLAEIVYWNDKLREVERVK